MDYQQRKEAEYAKQLEQVAKKNLEIGKQYLAKNAKNKRCKNHKIRLAISNYP